jgi:hypothetical protein
MVGPGSYESNYANIDWKKGVNFDKQKRFPKEVQKEQSENKENEFQKDT